MIGLSFIIYKLLVRYYKIKEAVSWFFISYKLKKLSDVYGSVAEIPAHKLPDMLGEIDPGFIKSVKLTRALNTLCVLLKLDMVNTTTGQFIGRGLRGELLDEHEIEVWDNLLQTNNPRRAIYDLLIEVNDLLPRFVEFKFSGPGGKESLKAWLNNETDILVTEHKIDNGEN